MISEGDYIEFVMVLSDQFREVWALGEVIGIRYKKYGAYTKINYRLRCVYNGVSEIVDRDEEWTRKIVFPDEIINKMALI